MKESKENKITDRDRISKLENKVIELEYRRLGVLKNLYNYGFQTDDREAQKAAWISIFSVLYRGRMVIILGSVLSFITAMIGIVLAYLSYSVVSDQNVLIETQNDWIKQQAYLQESERKSSYVFLLGNIYDQVYSELNGIKEIESRVLSDQTIASISSLSQSLKPYRQLKEDKLTEALSPERGQLLLFIVRSKLSRQTYQRIYALSDFSYSDLENVTLVDANLEGALLSNSSLIGANLFNSLLNNTNMSYCDLKYATLIPKEMYSLNIFKSDMLNTYVEESFIDRLRNALDEDLDNVIVKVKGTNVADPIASEIALGFNLFKEKYRLSPTYLENYRLGNRTYEKRQLILNQ